MKLLGIVGILDYTSMIWFDLFFVLKSFRDFLFFLFFFIFVYFLCTDSWTSWSLRLKNNRFKNMFWRCARYWGVLNFELTFCLFSHFKLTDLDLCGKIFSYFNNYITYFNISTSNWSINWLIACNTELSIYCKIVMHTASTLVWS